MEDLSKILDLDLKLPIRGCTYHVRPPDSDTGAKLMNLLAAGVAAEAGLDVTALDLPSAIVDDGSGSDFARDCLGDALDEMIAGGVDQVSLSFCVETAFLAWTVGKEFAEHWWATGGKAGAGPSSRLSATETPTRTGGASTTP